MLISVVRDPTYRVLSILPKEYFNIRVMCSCASVFVPQKIYWPFGSKIKGHLWRLHSQSTIQFERSNTIVFDYKIPRSELSGSDERKDLSKQCWLRTTQKKLRELQKTLSLSGNSVAIYSRIRTVKIFEIGFTFWLFHYLRSTMEAVGTVVS